MSDFDAVITGIQNKVKCLQEERDGLRAALEEQERRCRELQEALDNQHISLTNQEEQNQIINQGNTLVLKGDPTEIRQQIAQVIQTIDNALNLLSDSQ